MAGAEEPTPTFIIVDFHYNGTFAPKPLVYFDPDRASVRDVDFTGLEFSDFMGFVEKLTRKRPNIVYYCSPKESLSEGLNIVQNDGDYNEFIECAKANNNRIQVYVDHYNEPLFDWIEMEEPDGEPEDDNCDEDVDSKLSDDSNCEHEPDEEVLSTKGGVNDPFLKLLCPGNTDEDDEDEEDVGCNEPSAYPVHDETQDWDKMVPLLGMKFSNPEELKHCMSNYAVKHGYDLYYEKNDKNRLLVKCCKSKEPKCPFRLWASWMKNERTFQIKSLKDEHNCCRTFKLGSIVTYKWIGKHFVNEILERPKMSLRKMKAAVSLKFNLNVSVGQCKNAKKYALTEIEGSLKDHYAKLWDYGEEIIRTNPGSTVKMSVDIMPDSSTVFSKYYVCFKAVKDGWIEGCRRVICVDGCFLKGICRGELLAAVGRDANNHIYPLAWAVVNVENKETWTWFLDLLMEDIGGGNGSGLTFISDGHKGLLEAVKDRMPAAEHRLCARHIYANLKKKFKGDQFRKPFWRAVRSTTPSKFQLHMDIIKNMDISAYEYLMEREPKHWSRAFFEVGQNCDAMENGVSESFNSAVKDARRRPIITMLEEIRVFVMNRIYQQRTKGRSWDLRICPIIRREIKKLKVAQRFWTVNTSGHQQFEVALGADRYAVDLNNRVCTCRGWQLTGIPCLHGVAAISSMNHNAEDYVASCFTKDAFLASYAYSIHPLNGSSMWPHVNYHIHLPPKRRRLPGRPTIKRKRDESEREASGSSRHTVSRKGVLQMCTICNESGHNKSKCPKQAPNVPEQAPNVPEQAPNVPEQAPNVPEQAPVNAVPVTIGPRRKGHERITKVGLRRKVAAKDGRGCNQGKPVVLE